MAAEDGSNGAWCGDTEGHCSSFVTFCFVNRLRGPGNIKVYFRRCTHVFNSQ